MTTGVPGGKRVERRATIGQRPWLAKRARSPLGDRLTRRLAEALA